MSTSEADASPTSADVISSLRSKLSKVGINANNVIGPDCKYPWFDLQHFYKKERVRCMLCHSYYNQKVPNKRENDFCNDGFDPSDCKNVTDKLAKHVKLASHKASMTLTSPLPPQVMFHRGQQDSNSPKKLKRSAEEGETETEPQRAQTSSSSHWNTWDHYAHACAYFMGREGLPLAKQETYCKFILASLETFASLSTAEQKKVVAEGKKRLSLDSS